MDGRRAAAVDYGNVGVLGEKVLWRRGEEGGGEGGRLLLHGGADMLGHRRGSCGSRVTRRLVPVAAAVFPDRVEMDGFLVAGERGVR